MDDEQIIHNHGHSNIGINVGGSGGVNGPINITTNPGPAEPNEQPFEARRVKLLPVTERWLQGASAFLTIGMFASGYTNVRQVLDLEPGTIPPIWPLYITLGLLITAGVGWMTVGFLRKRTTWYPPNSLLPEIAGVDDSNGRGRLALVWHQGRCIIDGGKLRFYRKPLEWFFEVDSQTGRRRRVVTRSSPAAECRRNPQHWWLIEPTDTEHLG